MGFRTDQKIAEIANEIPGLELKDRRANGETVWEGWFKPVISPSDYGPLLDDLHHDRTVEVLTGAVVGVRHLPKCTENHGVNELVGLIGNPCRLFRIRLTDFDDRKMPLCEVLEPKITDKSRYHTRGLDGMCLYPPWIYPWTDKSSIIDLLKQALIWLVKWDVYDRIGRWIGSETPHSFDYLLANVRPLDSCTCFSGRHYGECCRNFHILVVSAAKTLASHRVREFQRIYPLYLYPRPETLMRFF